MADPQSSSSRASSKPGQYDVGTPSGACGVCGRDLSPTTRIVAALNETPLGFERKNICLECWPKEQGTSQRLAYWQTTVPQPHAKRKMFVDNEVLCEVFERLKDATEPAKLNFRFVLGLILMRKRLLVYETSREDDGKDIWTMRIKGQDTRLELLNPRLNEQQVAEVSQQLGEILNEEL